MNTRCFQNKFTGKCANYYYFQCKFKYSCLKFVYFLVILFSKHVVDGIGVMVVDC
jgi:hypothetical protein